MNEFLAAINEAQSIAISGHIRPDGDCVGSTLGLYNYICEHYPQKTTDIYLEMLVPEFGFLNRCNDIKTRPAKKPYDLFLALDCGSADRLGKFLPMFESAKKNIVVDHHISNIGFGNINYIEVQASSTSEIIYELLDGEHGLSKAAAEALYLGIVHDTGVFKHSCTSRRTMEIAGHLLELGANSARIIDESFYQKTYVQNQVLGRCLLESMLLLEGRVIASVIDRRTMDFYGANSHDLDGIIDQLRVTKGIEVAILLHETDIHEYKVSMRANGDVDVSKIASYFGGGGHKKAAGCTMNGSYRDILTNLCGHIEAAMQAEK